LVRAGRAPTPPPARAIGGRTPPATCTVRDRGARGFCSAHSPWAARDRGSRGERGNGQRTGSRSRTEGRCPWTACTDHRWHDVSTWGNGRSSTIAFVETVHGYFLFEASLSGTYVVSVRVRIYILTLYAHTDLHLHSENIVAFFVRSTEPAWFCRRRARHTDHCDVTRGRQREALPTENSYTRANSI